MKSVWFYVFLCCLKCCSIYSQIGPDPWDYEVPTKSQNLGNHADVPPDIRNVPRKTIFTDNNETKISDWFFKRILAIILKGGQVQKNEDDTVDVTLQMNFDQERWMLLNEYIASNKQFTEDIFRRSVGYVEDSIYKPTITEKLVFGWNEYIHFYLDEYKFQISWIVTVLTIILGFIWFWNRISHQNIFIISFGFLYLYEVFVSYKEAEQQEVQIFLAAVNTCKWYFWSSNCDLPSPDPLIFLRHMSPLKVGIRMFTTLISEPIIGINVAIKTIILGITSDLWYPLDKIMYGFLIVTFNILLIFLFIMTLFNYILNIPFNLTVLGLINIGVIQRSRTFVANTDQSEPIRYENNNRLSGPTLERFLDICSQALSTAQVSQDESTKLQLKATKTTNVLRRSASTGRLPNLNNDRLAFENDFGIKKIRCGNGSGDA